MKYLRTNFQDARRLLFLLLSVAGLILSKQVEAQEERFQCISSTITLSEAGEYPNYLVLTGASEISFIPPRESTLDIDRENRTVRLKLPGFKGVLAVHPTSDSITLLAPESRAELERAVQLRYPDATTIGPASLCPTRSGTGCYFDIEFVTPYKTKLTTRLLFMPSPGGILEVTLTSSTANFPSLHHTFTTFLNYLRIKQAR